MDVLSGNVGDDVLTGGAGGDVLSGDAGNDDLSGNGGDDVMSGAFGNDTLRGGAGNDSLYGGGSNDELLGGTGDDWLNGASGSDTLTGGDGDDVFVFNILNTAGIITDFTKGDDLIGLDVSLMEALGSEDSVLEEGQFKTFAGGDPGNIEGLSADHRILYDTGTGKLYYDADGSGSGAAIHFATLSGAVALENTDFFVYASNLG